MKRSTPQFLLDPEVTFLNHGSFGATPRCVLDAQRQWQDQLEREPVRFFLREAPAALDAARVRAARFVGCAPADLAFVPNATTAVNAVLNSMTFAENDEILTTNHRYDAVANTLERTARRWGARVRIAEVPFPLHEPEQITEAVVACMGPRTRLLVIDQITSPTALIFPVEEIIKQARRRGIMVLVDGAHAPGQIPLQVEALGADFWTGNLHKWVCAPKGTALLWVHRRHHDWVHPPVTSHGYAEGFHARFDWTGTNDPSAWLASSTAIELHETLGGHELRAAHHALVRRGREVVAAAIGATLPHPDDDRLYGSMATIPLSKPGERAEPIWDALGLEHGIEVPVFAWRDVAWLRISGFAAYNTASDYERLAQVLPEVLAVN
jgi:isopenicillin-N epimerase